MSLDEIFSKESRPVIDFIDRLRSLGIEKEAAIPQIAVVGDQSSGKSSVLEAISGIPFPRGKGLVTRCATRLCMTQTSDRDWTASIGLADDPDSKVVAESPDSLGEEINRLTEEICEGRTFSERVIEITIRSSSVPDLTVIDLPGIVRTNTKGQQKGVVDDVNNLLQSYLEPERTIILAVIPSNQDIATIDILERAEKVDPTGHRTVGVLTKPDLIDEGAEEEVLKVLLNERKPLKLGYFMVKNRSQKQLDDGLTLNDAQEDEKRYFQSHSVFRRANHDQLGVESLTMMLTKLLVQHIRKALPDLLCELRKAYDEAKVELQKLGAAPPATSSDCREMAAGIVRSTLDMVSKCTDDNGTLINQMKAKFPEFAKEVRMTKPDFEGLNDVFVVKCVLADKKKCTFELPRKHLTEVATDSRIGKPMGVGSDVWIQKNALPISLKCRVDKIETNLDIKNGTNGSLIFGVGSKETHYEPQYRYFTICEVKNRYIDEVIKLIAEDRGRPLRGFHSFKVFTKIVGSFVDLWKPCTSRICVIVANSSKTKMRRIWRDTSSGSRFAQLNDAIFRALTEALTKCREELPEKASGVFVKEANPSTTNPAYLRDLNKLKGDRFKAEICGAFSNDSKYGGENIKKIVTNWHDNIMSDNDEMEAQDMIDMLDSYWKVASKRFVDNIEQLLDTDYLMQMVRRSTELMDEHVTKLSDDDIKSLFEEDPLRKHARNQLQAKFERLQQALKHFESVFGATFAMQENDTREGSDEISDNDSDFQAFEASL
eukprot:TRINITY_DN3433_c0_g1_i3.p1 TRINITY_DN3433_c0_g1~~TRINITY_DN3433_c0_g1_i3.p1  ORF type:complete len:770 (+),score=166.09 TRINITY_DN3433_c0_g1_i3:53-2362(+)